MKVSTPKDTPEATSASSQFAISRVPAWKTKREILGMSAILLPFENNGDIDWRGFKAHVTRTLDAGLVPAVNMDTGYANLIDEATRVEVLKTTQSLAGGRQFVAGAFVGDRPGAPFARDAYLQQIASIQQYGGTPVFFQSFGLTSLPDAELLEAYREWDDTLSNSSASNLAPCSPPSEKSIRSISIGNGFRFRSAWAPSTVRWTVRWNGSAWKCEIRYAPSSAYSLATI